MELKNGTLRVCGYEFGVRDRSSSERKMASELMLGLSSVAEECYRQQWGAEELRTALRRLLRDLYAQGNAYYWIVMEIVSRHIVEAFCSYWNVSIERVVIHPQNGSNGSTLEAVRNEAEAPSEEDDEIPWDDGEEKGPEGAGGFEEQLEVDYERLPRSTGDETICSSIIRHHPTDGGGWIGTYLCPPTIYVGNYEGFLVVGMRTRDGWGEWGWWESTIGQLDKKEIEALAEFLDMCAFCSRKSTAPVEEFDREVINIALICLNRLVARYLYATDELMADFVCRGPVYEAARRVIFNASFDRTSCGRDVAER